MQTLKLEKSVWHFVPAFTVAYDETNRMTSDWGIRQVPSVALIDPNGNLVRDGNLFIPAEYGVRSEAFTAGLGQS
jgi:hypothetical protein